ncbi:MAG: nucleotidyl transferase AbiEii/AbiGii toxin family protein [bacterium]
MAKPDTLAPLLHALRDLMNWLETERVNGMVIGGVAASLLGRPRLTHDVDVLIQLEEERWSEFLSQGAQYNFSPRIRDSLEFAQKSRMLLLKHKPTHIDIDLAFAALPFEEESLLNASEFEIGDLKLRLPRPEDLIIMKAVAARPKDLIDIDSLIDANPNLEYERIRATVREFSNALDMSDLIENLDKILAKKRNK